MTPDDDPQLLLHRGTSCHRAADSDEFAARYPEAIGFLADERRMLAVYHAGTEAAALDAATALDEVREQRRHLVELLKLLRARSPRRERCRKSPTKSRSR